MSETITSNRALTRVAPTPTPTPTRSELEVRLDYARVISDAAAALPEAYRKLPGAILLADQWGAARGIDLLTVIQTVSFVKGRPVVDASMQRTLAKRAGYRLRSSLSDDGQSATVTVSDADGELGTVTYTMADARLAGLIAKTDSAWVKHPKQMLMAAATRTAIRWYAPDALLGVFDRDEIEDTPTERVRVDLLPADSEPQPAPVAPVETLDVEDADVEDADIVDGQLLPTWDLDGFRSEIKNRGVTQAQAVRAAQGIDSTVGTMAAIVDRNLGDRVLAALDTPTTTEGPF